jgi:hypothetical protein
MGSGKSSKGEVGPKPPVKARRMLIVLGRVRPFEWPIHVKIVLLGKAFAA